MKAVRNGKTDFKPLTVKSDDVEQEIIFTHGIKMNEADYEDLLPYINALDFEPFRDRQMKMDDPGVIGYRDEIRMEFSAVTDSYIPKINLPMEYFYDEEHI